MKESNPELLKKLEQNNQDKTKRYERFSTQQSTTTTTTNNNNQNPMISQQTMMDYARMSYRYTTVCDCLMTKFEIRIVFFVRR